MELGDRTTGVRTDSRLQILCMVFFGTAQLIHQWRYEDRCNHNNCNNINDFNDFDDVNDFNVFNNFRNFNNLNNFNNSNLLAIWAVVFESTDSTACTVCNKHTRLFVLCQVFGVQERIMAIALKKQMCSSLSDALETEPVLMSEEPFAAVPVATLPAFFVLFLAALFVAAWWSGPARLLRLDPPGVLPLLSFQLVMTVGLFVGAAMPAAMLTAMLVSLDRLYVRCDRVAVHCGDRCQGWDHGAAGSQH